MWCKFIHHLLLASAQITPLCFPWHCTCYCKRYTAFQLAYLITTNNSTNDCESLHHCQITSITHFCAYARFLTTPVCNPIFLHEIQDRQRNRLPFRGISRSGTHLFSPIYPITGLSQVPKADFIYKQQIICIY